MSTTEEHRQALIRSGVLGEPKDLDIEKRADWHKMTATDKVAYIRRHGRDAYRELREEAEQAA